MTEQPVLAESMVGLIPASIVITLARRRFTFTTSDYAIEQGREIVEISCAEASCAGCGSVHRKATGRISVRISADGFVDDAHWDDSE